MPRRSHNRAFRIPPGVDLRLLNRAICGDADGLDERTRQFLDGEDGRAIAGLVRAAVRKRDSLAGKKS